MDAKQKQNNDTFIDWLIDNVIFPKEVKEDGPGTRNTDQSANQTIPLQS